MSSAVEELNRQEPTDRGYGTDIGVRDPFGNHIRIVQFAGEVNQAAPKTAAKA